MTESIINGAAPQFEPATAPLGNLLPLSGVLKIDIYPRGCVWFKGSQAQLVAEGLIEAGFTLPATHDTSWVAGGRSYWLLRLKPTEESERWALRISGTERDGFAPARLFERQQELKNPLFERTPSEKLRERQYWQAKRDSAFQRLMATVLPSKKRRGRPAAKDNVESASAA